MGGTGGIEGEKVVYIEVVLRWIFDECFTDDEDRANEVELDEGLPAALLGFEGIGGE